MDGIPGTPRSVADILREHVNPESKPEAPITLEMPQNGVEASKWIASYSEAAARYMEMMGDALLNNAQKFRDECYGKAEYIRNDGAHQAEAALGFTEQLQTMAFTVEEAYKKYHGV